jgi:organic hydroperoxide reductase OsmC/OhrA
MSAQGGDHGPHRYTVRCHWSGSTAVGYETFSREHSASAPPALPDLHLSSDASFQGDPSLLNPEQLVVLAAASCQLLSFLAVAARAKVDVLGYDDHGVGVMTKDDPPMRLTSISLRPIIRVAAGTSEDRVRHLVEVAHRECFIANSLRSEVDIEVTVVVDPGAASEHY